MVSNPNPNPEPLDREVPPEFKQRLLEARSLFQSPNWALVTEHLHLLAADLYKLLEHAPNWDDARYFQGALWITKQLAGGQFESQVIARYTTEDPVEIPDYMPHPGQETE